MGLILNPVGYRIGHFRSWSDAWYMHRLYYPVFLHNVFLIKTLLHYLLYRFFPNKRSKWVYSHSNIYIFKNKIFISTYIYFSFYWKDFYQSYYRTFLQYKQFITLRMRSFWLKKTLLDRNKYAIRWFLLLYTMEIYVDFLSLEDWGITYNKRFYKKLQNLRLKYSRPDKEFLAVEEIWVILKVLMNMSKFFDKFGSTFLLKFFYSKFKSFSRFVKFKKNRFFWNDEKKRIKGYKWVRYNTVFLLYIMSFTISMLKISNPNITFNNVFNFFEYKDCSNILKKYFIWFAFRPVFLTFKKYIELFILKFGFSVTAKLFWINNFVVNAEFISRYISGAVKLKFQYKDMMIPLRKLLGRLVFFKIKKRLDIFKALKKKKKT